MNKCFVAETGSNNKFINSCAGFGWSSVNILHSG